MERLRATPELDMGTLQYDTAIERERERGRERGREGEREGERIRLDTVFHLAMRSNICFP
jgi:hypothetical protein